MDVVSPGPLALASVLWQPRPASWALTVVCKATFTLAPGESPLAPEQDEIAEHDAHWDDDGARSLRAASDLAPLKASAEVVLVGPAFAPQAAPARSVRVRLVVGPIDKSIEVFCDRWFDPQGALSEGPRFTRVPLVYERAAGGPDTWNPVGVRRNARDRHGRTALPNLQPPGKVVARPDDVVDPIGFGPLAPGWPTRREMLRRHAATWTPDALARKPLPPDVDRSYFNVAPPDQRTPELRGDEPIVLENLHPQHPRLITSLSGVRPRAVLTGRAGGPLELALRCDTLAIDTDRRICTLSFRGHVALAHPEERGRVIVVAEKPGRPLTVDQIIDAMDDVTANIGPESLEIDSADFDDFASSTVALPAPTPARSQRQATLKIETSQPAAEAAPAVRSPPPRAWKHPTLTAVAPKPLPAASPMPFGRPPAPSAPPALVTSPPPATPFAPVAPVEAPTFEPPARKTIGDLLAGASAVTPAPAPEAVRSAPDPAPAPGRDVLLLVWLDKKSLPRILRKPAWQRIVDALQDEPLDPEADDPALSDAPSEVEERAQVFEILDRAAATDREGLYDALSRAAGKRGKLVPPLELVAGDLALPFDEVATLEEMVSAATPLAAGDEALSGALATANGFLGSPGGKTAAAVAAGLTARIREALRQGKRSLPAGEVDAQVDRALLEGRRYQKRKVLGGPHLRALLFMEGPERPPVVCYLPEGLAEELPMAARFRARIIAEVHLAVDEKEAQPVALRAAALGRVARTTW
jgi:hypothetical protein